MSNTPPVMPPPPGGPSTWIEGPRSYLWPDGSFRDIPYPQKPVPGPTWRVAKVNRESRTITLEACDD